MKKKPAKKIERPWPPQNRMITSDQVTTRTTKPQASSPKPSK